VDRARRNGGSAGTAPVPSTEGSRRGRRRRTEGGRGGGGGGIRNLAAYIRTEVGEGELGTRLYIGA
jgi:hypothetical protein